MEKDCILKIKNDVAFRRSFDGTLVAVSPETDKILTLNESAAELWSLIDGKRTLTEIITLFAAHFETASLDELVQIESDVLEIIGKFLEKQLVEII
ncbi:PqqD family protein [bacterium]|nr:PqqD family protein [bacterium]MBP5590793.1 PqqD family protein [bacterium]